LRSPANLQKFLSAPVIAGQITAAMRYFNYAMSKSKLTDFETIELARAGTVHLTRMNLSDTQDLFN
jgi:hypothetical protein